MQNYFPNLPRRRAIFLQDRGPGMLFTFSNSELQSDLRHELTHAQLNDGRHKIPLWLDEGLAEYFEVDPDGRFLDSNRYLPEVSRRAAQGFIPSMLQLENIEQLQQFGDTQYRESWAWVHFLLHRNSETRALLVAYLQRLRNGQPQPELSRQLARLFPDVPQEFQNHFAELSRKLALASDPSQLTR